MALVPPAPAPMPPWIRAATYLGEPILWGVVEFLVDYFGQEDAPDVFNWRRVVVEYDRATPAGIDDDKAQWKLDFLNITGGQPDHTWNAADFAAVEAKLLTFLSAVNSTCGTDHTRTGFKWYRMAFLRPPTQVKRFENTGPPVRTLPSVLVGTGAGSWMPHQVAMSVTLKTSVPKHWGRFYLPANAAANMEATAGEGGRFKETVCTTVANAAAQMINDLAEADFQTIVPVTQINKTLTSGFLTPTHVQVDDIPDIIRRRRPRAPQVRQIGTYT